MLYVYIWIFGMPGWLLGFIRLVNISITNREEFSPAEIIFICTLKMGAFLLVHYNELGIQLSKHLVGPLPGLLGRDFWKFLVKSLVILVYFSRPSLSYRWRFSETLFSVCWWWRWSPSWWTLISILKMQYILYISATHPYPLVTHWMSTEMFC